MILATRRVFLILKNDFSDSRMEIPGFFVYILPVCAVTMWTVNVLLSLFGEIGNKELPVARKKYSWEQPQ